MLVRRGVRLGIDGVDVKAFGLAVHLGVDAANDAVSAQDGDDVITVFAKLLRHVYLDAEVVVEECESARPVGYEVIEGRKKAGARLPGAVLLTMAVRVRKRFEQ